MPKITFIRADNNHVEVEAPENWSVMQVAVENGINEIVALCGGAMACATCHCYIDPAWKERVDAQDNEQSDEEQDMLDMATDVRDCSRLGCQVKLNGALDGLVVALPGSDVDWD